MAPEEWSVGLDPWVGLGPWYFSILDFSRLSAVVRPTDCCNEMMS